jgi:hypothetical protein
MFGAANFPAGWGKDENSWGGAKVSRGFLSISTWGAGVGRGKAFYLWGRTGRGSLFFHGAAAYFSTGRCSLFFHGAGQHIF